MLFIFKGVKKILDPPLEGTLTVELYLDIDDTVTRVWGESTVPTWTADKGLM